MDKTTTQKKISNGLRYLVVMSLVLGISCAEKKKESSSDEAVIQDIAKKEMQNPEINTAKKVIYSLPSPLETALLLKHSNTIFDEELLNPYDNASNYSTQKALALNLGIYLADLCYASLYDQNQTTIHYMLASQEVADELGLMNIIDSATKDRLIAHYFDRDSVIHILSEAIMNSNAFIRENNGDAISSLVLYGGWIEGLFLASKLAEKSPDLNQILIDRIMDQGLSVEIVDDMLANNQKDKNIEEILTDLKLIKLEFEKLRDEKEKLKLQAGNEPHYKNELHRLFEITSQIRSKYIS